MKVANGMAHPLTAKVPGQKPTIVNQNTEVRWPAPTVTLPRHSVVDLKPEAAESIVKRFGREGLILVPDGMSDEDAITEAKARRMEWLEETMNHFRETNAQRRASNLEVLIPRRRHRDMLKELKVLRAELAEADRELYEDVTQRVEKRAQDSSLEGLEEFGITVENTPLTPGLTEAEALGG